MLKYDDCIEKFTLRGTNRKELIEPDESKVIPHFLIEDQSISKIFQQNQIDDCTWNFFNNMTDGSQGVECPNLDELYSYANDMKKGQKITCRRYLKDMDSSLCS